MYPHVFAQHRQSASLRELRHISRWWARWEEANNLVSPSYWKKERKKLFLTSFLTRKLSVLSSVEDSLLVPNWTESISNTFLWEGIDPWGTLAKKSWVSMASGLLCTRYVCVSQGPGASHADLSRPRKDGLSSSRGLINFKTFQGNVHYDLHTYGRRIKSVIYIRINL